MCPRPASERSRVLSRVTSRPPIRIVPESALPQPGDHLDQLALAVRVDARDADDLAALDLERHVPDRGELPVVARGHPLELEQRLAHLVLGLLHLEEHVAADHQPREAALGRALGRHRVDLLAPPQHGHAVGDVEHLVELVRDEHDAGAVRLQRAQHLEQVLRLLGGQHRGRLVQHEHLRAAEQRAEDLHALLRAHTEVFDLGVGVHGEPEPLRQLAGPAGRRLVVQQRPVGRLGAQHQVLGHAHDRDEHEVLVDHPDAQVDRPPRGFDLHRLAVEQDLALVGLVEPVEDVHQRRLARAVLTQQRVDLPALQLEVDRIVRDQRAEALGDPAQLEGGGRPGHRCPSYPRPTSWAPSEGR